MASNAAGAESVIQGGCGLSNKCKAGKYPQAQGSANTYSYLDAFPHFECIVEVAGLKKTGMAPSAFGARSVAHCHLRVGNLSTSKIKILIHEHQQIK